MLTDVEKAACRNATFMKGAGHGYGTPEEGLCPIGAVAVLRGAVPRLLRESAEYTFFEENHHGMIVRTGNYDIAEGATVDILAWTGHVNINHFLQALELRGTYIFDGLL